MIFIPGFGGTGVADSDGDDDVDADDGLIWLTTRGIAPDKLSLEPLQDSYSDIVQSLVNLGYQDGTNTLGVDLELTGGVDPK